MTVLGVLPLVAQEKKADSPETKRTYDPTRRVPDYFGQIGLTPEQRETIYKVRAKHQSQIDALEKQITELQTQMLAECEGVLTDTQKQLLDQRRRAATNGKKASEAPKTKQPAKAAS